MHLNVRRCIHLQNHVKELHGVYANFWNEIGKAAARRISLKYPFHLYGYIYIYMMDFGFSAIAKHRFIQNHFRYELWGEKWLKIASELWDKLKTTVIATLDNIGNSFHLINKSVNLFENRIENKTACEK